MAIALIQDVIQSQRDVFGKYAEHISQDDLKIMRSVLAPKDSLVEQVQQERSRERLSSAFFPTVDELMGKRTANIAHYGASFTEASFKDPRYTIHDTLREVTNISSLRIPSTDRPDDIDAAAIRRPGTLVSMSTEDLIEMFRRMHEAQHRAVRRSLVNAGQLTTLFTKSIPQVGRYLDYLWSFFKPTWIWEASNVTSKLSFFEGLLNKIVPLAEFDPDNPPSEEQEAEMEIQKAKREERLIQFCKQIKVMIIVWITMSNDPTKSPSLETVSAPFRNSHERSLNHSRH